MSGSNNNIIIIGGGAAGIVAAIFAKQNYADVTIIEKNDRIGKKILVTGNGRCNFTNLNVEVNCYSGKNPKFVYSSLASFNVHDTIDFFEKLGISHKIEEAGKVFPRSDQATSILDVLRYEVEELGIKLITNSDVRSISKKGSKFTVVSENGKVHKTDRIILATGGKAMPSSGSNGEGYELAKSFGHTVTDLYPGLVQLKLAGNLFKQIQGVKFKGTAGLFNNNKLLYTDYGDILFTSYGISGPPILQLSRKAAELLNKNEEAILKVKIIDNMNRDELNAYLTKRFMDRPKKSVEFSLVGLINKRIIPVILKEIGIKDINKSVANLTKEEKENLVTILTDWRFQIIGTKSWQDAQVTAGGINTNEVNQKTLESKLVKGLFFAGEILDIDGQCGGFNLQWAWSSGYLAGINASK
ncbi:hypothetical protein SAMN00017405_1469 [Desulfonispora thiosulfatigenes DSM 11270]|uniref:Flavoprotein, HI0933 family n=1 Tax=Desulfonispora thiosulfatigenes DSM 11270 TaxID=656914 RepID=A0A1W1VS14_DESTI|nr:NAD(P)/FAD-dependent oxidoreductase [Desulfonispora thiosulfatigenes]SMB96175.1 hypothetical protein SAMN00017405_1469 [Desulfonispora thiosulfatigenes DSM 11270]